LPVILKSSELSDEHLRQIGRVVTAGAWLEMMIRHTIEQIGRIDHRTARCITTHALGNLLLDMLMSVARTHLSDEAKIDRLVEIVGRVKEATRRRNDTVHTIWASHFDHEEAIRNKGRIKNYSPMGVIVEARGRVKIEHRKPEEYDFEETYNLLIAASNELNEFLSDLFDAGYFSSSQ
jgi:hypothetical protein